MTFTAILSGQCREIYTTTPKTMFLDIRGTDSTLLRDHTWVTITDDIRRLMPKSSAKKKCLIQFDADSAPYISSEGSKITLCNISNIRCLKRNISMEDYRANYRTIIAI